MTRIIYLFCETRFSFMNITPLDITQKQLKLFEACKIFLSTGNTKQLVVLFYARAITYSIPDMSFNLCWVKKVPYKETQSRMSLRVYYTFTLHTFSIDPYPKNIEAGRKNKRLQ